MKGPVTPPRNFSVLLLIACVFAVVGGFTDAYSYLAHSGVFANAQTGNVVLFAVSASGREWTRAVHYLPPIGAFAAGVVVARLLGLKLVERALTATVLCQVLECVVLIGVSVAGDRLGSAWVVPLLAFCSALQNTSFDSIGPWTFNTAMTTGNLRSGVSGLVLWMAGKEPEANRHSSAVSLSVMFCFASGALLGAFCTRWIGERALAACVVLVLAGIALTYRERLRQGRSPAAE